MLSVSSANLRSASSCWFTGLSGTCARRPVASGNTAARTAARTKAKSRFIRVCSSSLAPVGLFWWLRLVSEDRPTGLLQSSFDGLHGAVLVFYHAANLLDQRRQRLDLLHHLRDGLEPGDDVLVTIGSRRP